MYESVALLLTLPAAFLVALVGLTDAWANAHVHWIRRSVTIIAAAQFFIVTCLTVAFVGGWVPRVHADLLTVSSELSISITIYFDGVASLMLTLVSFIGWVICQYSIRYLDGESTQGSYFRWTGFTIGSVALMVLSGNLLMFIVAWVMTSLGLHRLLLHYGHRPAAQRAAWTKFTVSRLGDAALIIAMTLIYSQFKTLDFAELFELASPLTIATAELQVAGFLLVLGAATKSAQLPFHSWLPQTMETPTPVSALMHAGIVNAGGYLIIRTSSLIAITPLALTTLAIIGSLTACFGAVVMLTQTNIKKSLAYSTIAQMGFMLLQCGLGAYSAAMLHILAHSLYKAHAFLSSGGVITQHITARGTPSLSHQLSAIKLAIVGAVMVMFLGLAFMFVGINPTAKPGGLLLGGILCLALTHWVGQVMRCNKRALLIPSMTTAAGLCLVYSISFGAIDKIVAPSFPTTSVPEVFWFVAGLVVASFFGMFVLQAALTSARGIAFLSQWHVHASNGFYLESILRRMFGPLLSS